MLGVNSVTLAGVVGSVQELKHTTGGKAVFTFRLEIPSRRVDGTATATKVDVSAWEKYAETLSRRIVSGTWVMVTGKLSVRRYQVQGAWKTDVSISPTSVVDLDDSASQARPAPAAAPKPEDTEPEDPFPPL